MIRLDFLQCSMIDSLDRRKVHIRYMTKFLIQSLL